MKKENKDTFIYFLMIILSFLLGKISGFNICKNYYNNYDVNKDGIVNSQDYVLIKKYIMDNK